MAALSLYTGPRHFESSRLTVASQCIYAPLFLTVWGNFWAVTLWVVLHSHITVGQHSLVTADSSGGPLELAPSVRPTISILGVTIIQTAATVINH